MMTTAAPPYREDGTHSRTRVNIDERRGEDEQQRMMANEGGDEVSFLCRARKWETCKGNGGKCEKKEGYSLG